MRNCPLGISSMGERKHRKHRVVLYTFVKSETHKALSKSTRSSCNKTKQKKDSRDEWYARISTWGSRRVVDGFFDRWCVENACHTQFSFSFRGTAATNSFVCCSALSAHFSRNFIGRSWFYIHSACSRNKIWKRVTIKREARKIFHLRG